jgi:subtilisin family serine protease
MTRPTDVETTGRYLVLLEEDSVAAGMSAINRVTGIRTVSTADASGASVSEQFDAANGLMLHELGVAVVNAGPEQVSRLNRAAAEPGPISVVEPERVVHAIAVEASALEAAAVDESRFTWGVQAVGANLSNATGAGIRVAVLDTGVDKTHPDLAGRTLVTSSFVNGEDVQDGHGHGTHCIGTSCGPRTPQTSPGYGIAHQAEIYAGKVLGNRGSGDDGGILAGISWAITNGCAVVSMSLGADVAPGTPYSQVYEQAAQRAMSRGTLIIAAAGNASDRRNGRIAPVGHPANCPSVMAIAAIDVQRGIAPFSSGTVDVIGQVDLAAPGVDVHSSWPMPTRYRRISGTSMATPHVSGVAALIAQQTGARGWELWARLVQSAHRLPLPSTDVGAGLVQAP